MSVFMDATRLGRLRPSFADPAWRGIFSQLSPPGRRARLSIVLFHRVMPVADPLFPEDPDGERFDEICSWLAAWFNVLPLDEGVRRLARDELPARALAITFDDGYADNHDLALPILRSHGLCATFFVATGFLGGGRMWNDTVVEALRGCRAPSLSLSGLGTELPPRADLSSVDARRQAVHVVLQAAKYLSPDQRLAVVERLAERCDVRLPDNLMMTEAQVRALAAAGMQIGAHTVGHPILARVSEATARAEMQQSRATLEDIVGRKVDLFAYPNGKPGQDYLACHAALARELGFAAAVSTAPGAARRSDGLGFELPRFTPWDRGRQGFALRLARNLAGSRPQPAQA